MKTWAQLKDEIRREVFASGEAENLVTGHDSVFQEGAGDISKWVECEQQNNVDIIHFCKTNFKCGMTVVPAPRGIIKRVYTVANANYCNPVFYRQVDWPGPECWSRNLLQYTIPLNVGFPKLPQGFLFSDKSTDSVCGRAMTGIWAIHEKNIYIAPWIQSNEYVVIEWIGIKELWGDNDLVNAAQDYKKTLKLYLVYGHEYYWGDKREALMIHNLGKTGTYDEALADLAWQCREETKRRAFEQCADERDRSPAEIAADAIPVVSGTQIVAQIGNYGNGDSNAAAVAAMVKLFSPSAILTSGNNATSSFDASAGALYHDFISPYTGAHGAGAQSNAFWPAPGASDWAIGVSLNAYIAFFNPPNNGRYYDVCFGDLHVFVVDSNNREVDGNTQSSTQGQWLQAKLILSTAKWKVVLLHQDPYSSTLMFDTDLRWPYHSWGADMVISGRARNYERLFVNGLNYIVNGLGGNGPFDAFGSVDANSQFRYNTTFGAGRVTITKATDKVPDTFLYEFLNASGAVIDSVTLTK